MKNERLDLQFFADEGLGDLLGYLGVGNDDASDSAGSDNQETSSDGEASTDESGTQTNATQTTTDDKENKDSTDTTDDGAGKKEDNGTSEEESKKAFAFAQLRQEANQKKQLLSGLQRILNIPENTPVEDVMTKVQEAIVKAESKQTGVPEEIITKINTLEQRDKEYRAHQLQENAYLGFSKVQKEFGLDNDGIKTFAIELMKDNLNPFEQDVDVLKEYKLRHFDDIVNSKVTKAIQEEQQRAAKASTQSTQPGNTQGQTKGETGKINSVKELDNWLNTQQK
jgi:hypothetical protein